MMRARLVAVDRHCYQLYQSGYLRRFNSGIYQLTDDGETHLIQHRSEFRQ